MNDVALALAALPADISRRAAEHLLGDDARLDEQRPDGPSATPAQLLGCAERLLASPDTEVRLAALGLLLAGGDLPRARGLLDQHGAAWLDSGAGPSFWTLLANEHAPE